MFLQLLYKQWRVMFWVVMLLVPAQFFFMYKGIQNTPFFLYHMFSTPHARQDSLPVVLIKTNKGYFNHTYLSNREGELLLNDIELYNQLKSNRGKDALIPTIESRFKQKLSVANYQYLVQHLTNESLSVSRYPQWWKQYFNSIVTETFDSISVVQTMLRYQNGTLQKAAADSLIFTVYNK